MINRIFRRSAPTLPNTPSPKKALCQDDELADIPQTVGPGKLPLELSPVDVRVPNIQVNKPVPDICEKLLNFSVLLWLEWREIGKLHQLNRLTLTLCDDQAIAPGLWMAICQSLANEASLYIPSDPSSILLSSHAQKSLSENSSGSAWKRFFFENLWPARGKWDNGESSLSSSTSFKINICIRFRPLQKSPFDDKLGLPLHQYIRLRRQQAKEAGKSSSSVTVGSVPPPHLLDGIFGVLLRDPVKLPSSGVIVERKTAEENIRQRPRDLLDDTPLTTSQLIEMPDLKREANEWREQMMVDGGDIDRIQRSEIVRDLVDSNSGLPPEVIEALVEAERTAALSKRAEMAAREDPRTPQQVETQPQGQPVVGVVGDNDDQAPTVSAAEVTESLPDETDQSLSALSNVSGHPEDINQSKENLPPSNGGDRRKDLPRVLGVQPSRVVMFVPGHGVRPFNFGRVLESDQEQCYQSFARPSVVSLLNGFNASLFCYGQTGGGKSHTIFGPTQTLEQPQVVHNSGIVVRVLEELLSGAQAMSLGAKQPLTVGFSAQYVEIYNDEMTDLLTGERCEVLRSETGNISGAADCPVNTLEEGLQLLRAGQLRKRIAQTAMNDRSSRAHSIFLIKMRQCRGDNVMSATLQLVDLAGSERLKKSKAEGTAKLEAVGINESLLVLGKVISALVESKSHVPYFESKLTTLLRSALGGASRTTAVVCCRGEDDHALETLQALRFGERCGEVTNKRQQASVGSAKEALASIDATLLQCSASAAKLRERHKTHLPAFKSLEDRIQQLTQRRRFIADIARAEENKQSVHA